MSQSHAAIRYLTLLLLLAGAPLLIKPVLS
jgi:hypothetical protein